ncbi:MAG: hypothetical protein KDD41_04935 [Flavobacteriales bacterium]|nr:hypothetical protein [Flavobacteriales bacterium]
MKLHLAQKIGLIGMAFITLVAVVFYLGDYFSPYIFAAWIPFAVLILIGYSIKSRTRNR